MISTQGHQSDSHTAWLGCRRTLEVNVSCPLADDVRRSADSPLVERGRVGRERCRRQRNGSARAWSGSKRSTARVRTRKGRIGAHALLRRTLGGRATSCECQPRGQSSGWGACCKPLERLACSTDLFFAGGSAMAVRVSCPSGGDLSDSAQSAIRSRRPTRTRPSSSSHSSSRAG